MNWKFIILNNRTSEATVIEEPVGWDKNRSEIKRDPDWHGIFFENQGDAFEFDGIAERLLRSEYDQYGVEANMTLQISQDCGQGYVDFYEGKFDFSNYSHYCDAGRCFVMCPVESLDDVMKFRNRKNQKANLESLKSFDETTDLAAYDKIAFNLELPSKGIFLQDHFLNEKEFTTPVQGVPENNNPGSDPSSFNSEWGMIEIGFDKTKAAEIGNASTLDQSRYRCVLTNAGLLGCNDSQRFVMSGSIASEIAPLDLTPYVNFADGTPNYEDIENPCQMDLVINGNLHVNKGTINAVFWVLAVLPGDKVGDQDSDYVYLAQQMIYEVGASPGLPPGSDLSLDVAYTNNDFVLNKGDRIYCFYTVYHRRQNADQDGTPGWTMTFYAGNYFKLTDLSHTPATVSKAFAIMETISRVTEIITDDKLRAFSEYFGRTDSQPYTVPADGCGSLAVVTDGLRIRGQENKIPGETSPFALSMDDLFLGLNPVHNIGMGVEPDPNRSGFNRLRVEPWAHFYNDSVIMSCTDVNKITRRVNPKDIFSSFRFGFGKWEAEEYNGLDEFLTKRIYRTSLSQVNNELSKLSTMIMSGYAIEITRRKGREATSKDWRYDKETFMICCTRDKKFHVIFDPAIGTGGGFHFEWTGDPGVFVDPTITIAGTASNNGTFSVFAYTFTGNIVTVQVSSGTIVAEDVYGVSFTSITFPADSLFVEFGNINSALNIIDPPTLYNFRRSPVRNAMRWLNKILVSYRSFTDAAKLIFTDGDANVFAEGELPDGSCKLENRVIKENMMINREIFNDTDEAAPFLLPERVTFDYPMNSREYNDIRANPNGLIYFENDCDSGHGYIEKIIYQPEQGIANFSLIPTNKTLLQNGFTTEGGFALLTEDGQQLIIE